MMFTDPGIWFCEHLWPTMNLVAQIMPSSICKHWQDEILNEPEQDIYYNYYLAQRIC